MKEFVKWFKTEGYRKYLVSWGVVGVVDYGFISNVSEFFPDGESGFHYAAAVTGCLVVAAANVAIMVHMLRAFKKR